MIDFPLLCSYKLDLDVERAEDVLIHKKILEEAKDPDKRPVFHVRFLKVPVQTKSSVVVFRNSD